MNKEIWKDIPNYEGLYQASNLGRIKSLERIDTNNHIIKERVLKQKINKSGYLYVMLYKNHNRKTLRVHKLVAQTFIPNPNNYLQINHKDENKHNNCIDNLEWCTPSYNQNYGTRNEKVSKKVLCIETGEVFPSVREASRTKGINVS